METRRSIDRSADAWTVRVGARAGIVGAVLGMVGNLLHPATPTGDPAGVARAIAQSDTWVVDHLAIVLGLILMLGALSAITSSIRGGVAEALARLGLAAGVAGIAVGLVLVTLDGLAAKHLADAWASAPPDETAIALRLVSAEQTLDFALASLFNILFAGVTFILYGLAVIRSGLDRPWAGWLIVGAGLGSLAVGFVQAYVGESTGFTKIMTIVFPTVITLWLARMCLLLARRQAAA